MKDSRMVLLALLGASTLTWAQTPSTQSGSTMIDEPVREGVWTTNLGNDPLGPGDLVYLSITGAPEVSRSYRLDPTGEIALPIGTGKISLQGLTPDRAANAVREYLINSHIFVAPIVSISVLDYRSRQITVVGAVKQPGLVQGMGDFRVLDAVARAGGLAPEAGSNVIITRHTDGQESHSIVAIKDLLAGSDSDQNFELRGGDEVRVPEAPKIYIVGNIKTPGVYSLADSNGTTVLKALAMSQGQLTFTAKDAYIYRSVEGKREEIPVPLNKILHRSAPDVALNANDILYVPENSGMHLTATVLDRMATFGGSVGSGLIIWH
jgi:polysaccharide biosynthesis/export protein